ncbi:MAG: PD40 domain-containing protein [Acidobacteria bacterium]|nr:PD40 domain-containing protein [Acidobacteriota bacterium]
MSSTDRTQLVRPHRRPLRLWLQPLALALALAAALTGQRLEAQGANKVVYDKFDWLKYQSTHFEVYYYSRGKNALPKVVSMAESSYDELSRRLNFNVAKPIPLIYYTTHSEFEQNNVILNFIPEGVGAFAEPVRQRMVLPIDSPDEKLQNLIQHELTHIFQYEILYGGRLSRAIFGGGPTWFMEGMASYFANDEDEKDRMFIRDAVNSDQIPPITKVQIEGYSAYRFGHAVFDFIEAEWGRDAVRDFVFEFRSFFGRDVSQALKRTFDVDPDDFDQRFRRYLRKKYLPLLAVKGEANDFGERFRVGPYERPSYEIGAAPSPSGDFVATLTTFKEDVDIALVSAKTRRLYKNISPGRTTRYEYISAQYLTTGPESGRDLSFAPDGDRIAVFGRHERGRKLLIFSVRGGGLLERIPVSPDIPLSPSFSPDGKQIVFSGVEQNSRDLFLLDLATRATRNITNDDAYDRGPVFSQDGKYIYYEKILNGSSKIVRVALADLSKTEQITWGEGNDQDPALSPDGKRLYFTSSRNGGIFNIFSQDLTTGDLVQYTDVIGAALGPAAYLGPDGQEKVVYSGFEGGRFQLYVSDAKKPLKRLEEKALPAAAITKDSIQPFSPALEVAIDPEKSTRPKFKMFLENASAQAGINTDQTFVSLVRLDFSDLLGNKRGIFVFDSVSTFSNFQLSYFSLKNRLQLGVTAYDQRQFYYGYNEFGEIARDRRLTRDTGISASAIYPLTRFTRVGFEVGFLSRKLDVPLAAFDANGNQVVTYDAREDNVPTAGVSFSYDATRYKSFGAHSGQLVVAGLRYLPNLKDSGTLSLDATLEARKFVPLSRRTLLAFRGFGGYSDGDAPNVFYFGGLDTLRGYDYRTFVGTRAFYVNAEFRFPLVDIAATPLLVIQGVRGRVFLDIGGSWLENQRFVFWHDYRLQDARASYGAGFTVFFLGLPINVDFARQWDGKTNLTRTRSTFYIGYGF